MSSGNQIVPARVAANGTTTTATNLVQGSMPSLAYDGVNFVVAYMATSTQPPLSGIRVSPSGTKADTTSWSIAATNVTATGAALAAAGRNVLTAYARFDTTPGVSSDRIRTRLVSVAAGEACLAAADCASGNCVDGVCCNTECGGGDTSDCQACRSRREHRRTALVPF